jgi:hypothetical protein
VTARFGALLVLLTACGGVQVHARAAPGDRIPARVVAVYPFATRFDQPAYRSYERAMDSVGAVLATGRLAALGPSEFKVLNVQNDQIYAATNLARSLAERGLHPNEVLALRGWAERREQSEVKASFDRTGKFAGQRRGVDVRLVVHEELLGPTELLGEAWAEVPTDPFADHPTYDDLPELRHWVIKLTEAVLAEAEPRLETKPTPTDPGFTFQVTLKEEERFSPDSRPTLEAQLIRMDPLIRESSLLDRVLYFYPDISTRAATSLQRLPAGLLVDEVSSVAARRSGLRPGDLIAEVEGESADGPQTLLRWLAFKDKVRLAVLRGPERVDVSLAAPR